MITNKLLLLLFFEVMKLVISQSVQAFVFPLT